MHGAHEDSADYNILHHKMCIGTYNIHVAMGKCERSCRESMYI